MAITLDVTGFYFSECVPFTNQSTVLQVMEEVRIKTQNSGVKFDYGVRPTDAGSKLSFISVKFDDRPARSRQVGRTGAGADKNERFFHYDDSALQLMGPTDKGQAQYALAWQYYVTDASGALKSGTPIKGGVRRIVAFSEPSPDYTLAHGDTITWRLVAIFGTSVNGAAVAGKGYAVATS